MVGRDEVGSCISLWADAVNTLLVVSLFLAERERNGVRETAFGV